MLHEEAISTFAIAGDRMKGHKKLFSCDGSKKITHHVIKVISWWRIDRIIYFLLDLDAASGTNDETTEVITLL